MVRSRRVTPPNPFLLWSDLLWKTTEMMVASSQVIGHRVGRMAAAGPLPSARDQREFTLMGQEKVEAAAESGQAVALQLMKVNQRLWVQVSNQMLQTATAMWSLAGSRTVAQSMAQQARLARILGESAATASQLAGAGALVARQGLRPIYSRATANAKRLARNG